MGSIVKVFKNDRHISWQARIVRSGLPKFTICFNSYDEACEWLSLNEKKYINDHERCLKEWNRLDLLRNRREARTGKI
jgi:hypothetical protein